MQFLYTVILHFLTLVHVILQIKVFIICHLLMRVSFQVLLHTSMIATNMYMS